jgi:hypothetical protein
MPRTPLVEYENAVYHVMARGNRREAIVLDDGDRELFRETFAEACGRTGWEVFAMVAPPGFSWTTTTTPSSGYPNRISSPGCRVSGMPASVGSRIGNKSRIAAGHVEDTAMERLTFGLKQFHTVPPVQDQPVGRLHGFTGADDEIKRRFPGAKGPKSGDAAIV